MDDPVDALRTLHPDRPETFALGQPWRAEPEAGFRPTEVRVTFRDRTLHVVAEMVDDEVFNDATAHNQATWELGDVFEIFVRRDDAEAYTEVHVTPDNVRLHLRFSDYGHAARAVGFAGLAADPDLVASRAERTSDGWRATAAVPVDAGPGERIRVSFCRYDAARGREPVLSTSSPHPVVAFHRPLEWTLCAIAR